MVEVKAFRGYRYNPEKADVQKAISPPYDVIDDDMKAELGNYEYNFVHLNLNESHDKAGDILEEWIRNGILVREGKDSLYAYQQEFIVNDKKFTRIGFVCLLKIEEWGKDVLAHEQTFPKIVDERYDLMEKTKANFGNLFMFYEDEKKEIDHILDNITGKQEDMIHIDASGIMHRLWKIDDEDVILGIVEKMKNKKAIMADGHHRYQTALNFHKDHAEIKGAENVMVTLVNSFNEGLIILPTNRILNDVKFNIDDFSGYFEIEKIENLDNIKLEEKSFVVAKGKEFYYLRLKEENILDEVIEDEDYKNLDMIILHKLVFNKILNLTDEKIAEKISFIKGNEATIKALNEGNAAFFVRPPTLRQTIDMTMKGKIMPQKSTYFFPKLFSGFVINKFGG